MSGTGRTAFSGGRVALALLATLTSGLQAQGSCAVWPLGAFPKDHPAAVLRGLESRVPGEEVSSLGDIAGDGITDFVVGDRGYRAGPSQPVTGRVLVGNGRPTWSWVANAFPSYEGTHAVVPSIVPTAGGRDGNGSPDRFFVGAPSAPLWVIPGTTLANAANGVARYGVAPFLGPGGDPFYTYLDPAGLFVELSAFGLGAFEQLDFWAGDWSDVLALTGPVMAGQMVTIPFDLSAGGLTTRWPNHGLLGRPKTNLYLQVVEVTVAGGVPTSRASNLTIVRGAPDA